MTAIVPTEYPHTHARLALKTFDSSEECSFEHWIVVHELLNEEEIIQLTETTVTPELETATWN